MIQLRAASDCQGDIDFLHKCYSSPDIQGEFQQTRIVDRQTIRTEIQLQAQSSRYIFIIADDELCIGYGYAFRSRTFDHFEIGVTLIPEVRRKGYGLLAHRLLITRTTATYQARRLMAYVCINNMPERLILERCHFLHEGTMRQAGTTHGVTHDIAIYGVLQQEIEVS
jgi:RimJ/RimL family protein N-acetyltransferase